MNENRDKWLERTELLLGREKLERLRRSRVLVVGLGGVGAYAAEMIARAGVGHMTVADADVVSESNINRQLIALHSTVGRPKTEVMAERLRDINPDIDLRTVARFIKDEETYALLDSDRFLRSGVIHTADVDLRRISAARLSDSPFSAGVEMAPVRDFRLIRAHAVPDVRTLNRRIEPRPFVPSDSASRDLRCREIFSIQSAGLAKRIEHTSARKLVLGISGGLDSTLALLVCVHTLKLLNRPPEDVITVTMPGFGTTDRTYNNAVGLCRELGTTLMEISIKDACMEHFRSIGHDPENHNVVYENSQARERTQILLDLANKENGLAVGTGDLSESAMGWCTYNGDHISMYSVNCSVPKTLIRYVIGWVGDNSGEKIRAILQDIIDTPVSPELLPADKDGTIRQKTEDIIGPYEIHDFFLYHFLKYGAAPEKLLFLAESAFAGEYPAEKLKQFLKTFLRRFFGQQFKRSCMPDGPKVGTISLSPRGDWRMPSDASASVWFENLEEAEKPQ